MKLNEAYLILVPNVDPKTDKSTIEKENYKCITVLINDEEEALEVAKDLVETENINAFILCPGFSNSAVGKMSSSLGEEIAVNVARGDGRSAKIVDKIIETVW